MANPLERFGRFYSRIIYGTSLRTIAKGFYGLLAFIILLVIDLVSHSLKTIQGPTLDVLRAGLQFVSLYYWGSSLSSFYIRQRDISRFAGKPAASTAPVHALRWMLITLVFFCGLAFLPLLFDLQLTESFAARTPSTVVSISIINAVWIAGMSILFGSFYKLLTLWQRTREVSGRNILWSIATAVFVLYSYLFFNEFLPQDTIYTIIHLSLRALIVFAALFLWYRVPWIPHLTKEAKNKVLTYSTINFLLVVGAYILYDNDMSDNLLRNYSIIIHATLGAVLLGLGAYFGLLFFNALFTLSSTELVERRQAEVRSLAKLTRFSSDVLTSDLLLDVEKLADEIAALAREATQSDCAWIELRSTPTISGHAVERTYRSFDRIPSDIAERISTQSNGFFDKKQTSLREELTATARPIVVNNKDILTAGWRRNGDDENSPDSLHSVLSIPLVHKAEIRGAIYVAKEKEYGFDDEDATVLSAFCDVASLALDTARLLADSIEKQKFDGELRAARGMQQSLLPSTVPHIEGYEVSAISIPAYEVGGDYYDFLTLQDTTPLVITGDVSGKGISASIFMAETKGIVQALAPRAATVSELLIGTNDALMRNVPKGATSRSFVTLAAMSLQPDGVRYCRAGHTPILHLSADGSSRYMQPKGMGIGFVKQQLFAAMLEEETITLAQGDVLMLFSDGITEVRNAENIELGYERLARIASDARKEKTTRIMTDRILRDLLLYAKEAQFGDDATFVIVRRT